MIHLFIGLPGTGKSLAMQDTARILAHEGWGMAVIDRAMEWDIVDKDGQDNARWRNHAPSEIYVADTREAKRLLLHVREKGGLVLFQPPWEPLDVAQLCAEVGDLFYVDDEIDLVASYDKWKENPIRRFVHTGRHLPDERGYPREMHILGACRRIQNIHTDVTGMRSEIFIFRSRGYPTLKRLWDEGIIESEEDEKRIKEMPDLHYLKVMENGTRQWGHLTPIGQGELPLTQDEQRREQFENESVGEKA